jgi:RNA polymerase sigma factor (sigma-70 family)
MRDGEVVAAIVAGDPGGPAEAYDRYASSLYTYCRSLLRDPADAADAVQDTFVIATAELAGLRDRNRLRPWLYAVARNECHRRRRAATTHATASLDALPEVTDVPADVSEAERAELRALVRSATCGLTAAEQDLIRLQLEQGLDVTEIAAILGVSRQHAHALVSRARSQLETLLGVLLVARTGREFCAELRQLLGDWDGLLTLPMRKRVSRHIERCPVCARRKRRELAPELLLGVAPMGALPFAAMPAGLKRKVLRLANGHAPKAVAYRERVARRAGPFRNQGFPKPIDPPRPRWRPSRPGPAAAAAAFGVAALAAAALLALALAGARGSPSRQSALAGDGVAPAAAGPASGAGPSPGSAVGPGSAHPTVSANLSPSAAMGGRTPTTGGSAASAGSASRSGRSASSPARSSGPPAAVGTSVRPPPQGTLTVTPATIRLNALLGSFTSSISLTASGGPVSWSITESSSLAGKLSVSPLSGTLAAGQSATVGLTAEGIASATGQLTVDPGAITVAVTVGFPDGP